ncbi:MAG: hypothetical protein HQK96_02555 [Nitrospirae bacterium]|nr:hypothetical protein [Nitrospirota bacterium]
MFTDLMEYGDTEENAYVLDRIKISQNEILVVPFTMKGVAVDLHYCEDEGVKGYVVCNGSQCLLCRVGNKKDGRLLLPVFLPVTECIGVLPISTSMQPHSLMPQLKAMISKTSDDKPAVVSIVTATKGKYIVNANEYADDSITGDRQIKNFMKEYEAGKVDLTSVFTKLSNEDISRLNVVSKIMKIKGIKLGAY